MSTYQYTPRHRKPEVLQDLADRGLTQQEMAKELRVSTSTISKWCSEFDIVPQHGNFSHDSYKLDEYKPTGSLTKCPDCGRERKTSEKQQACMQKHAADKAAILAAFGADLL